MELVAYIRLFRKWFWLLFLGAFLAGGASFLYRSQQPEEYQASVKLLVGSFIETPNPDSAEIRTGVELAQTYAEIAKTYDVLEAAIQARNFPVTPGQLRGMMTTSVVPETSLLVLTFTYNDPVLVADMANEVAEQLRLNSPSNLTPEQQSQIDLQTAEVERLNQELEQYRLELRNIDEQVANTTDAALLVQLNEQRNTLIDQINSASANIAMFANNITSLQRRTNSLDIVERARIPTTPIGTSVIMSTILGAIVGVMASAGLVLLIEYLDDTIHTPEEATQMLGLPTLAAISRFGKTRDEYADRLITYHDPGSPVSEEYRTLRTNLLFSSNGGWNKGAYIITSPGPSEGKSVTTANLAVTMAMTGLRVLLIDADLRRPRVHELFNIENNVGMSALLSADPGEAIPEGEGRLALSRNLKASLQDTQIPGLRVITSGYIPLNPTEVLGSVAMQRWFQEFRASKNVDIILFDTPPALVVADSVVLASAIKVPVVMVIEANQTRRGAALRAKEQFDQLGIEVKGIVLNSISQRERGYGHGYGYYYYYKDPGSKTGSSS